MDDKRLTDEQIQGMRELVIELKKREIAKNWIYSDRDIDEYYERELKKFDQE